MFFDDEAGDWMENLDDETCQKLADLLSARAEYFQAASMVARMRAEQLKGSKIVNPEELDEYVKQVLDPRRAYMHRLMQSMLSESLDINKIKSLVPMVAAGLMSQVDFELIFNVVGVDVDLAKELLDSIREFIK